MSTLPPLLLLPLFILWTTLWGRGRAAPGTAVPNQSFLEKTLVTGYGYSATISGTVTLSTLVPGLLASAVCSSAGLVAVVPAYAGGPADPTNQNLFNYYTAVPIITSTNWVSGGCTAFVINAPQFEPCTESLNVICSRAEPTDFPATTVIVDLTTVTATSTVTDTVTLSVLTVTNTITSFATSVLPSTTVSTVRTTSRTTVTATTTLVQTTATITVTAPTTVTLSQSFLSVTTDPFTVTLQDSVVGSTESVVSLTDDISSVVVDLTVTVTSCPFTTTTDSTSTITSTVASVTGTTTVTGRTRTTTRTRSSTTGTCSLSTFTTVQSTGTVTSVATDTVLVVVPPPPCPTVSPCDRVEGCYACPYEFPCGLFGPLERCGIESASGLVLAVSKADKGQIGCVCENVGIGLSPAAINGTNQEDALGLLSGCLGSWQSAWIGSWNAMAVADQCLALFVEAEFGSGGAGVPPDCQLLLPVLCGPR